MRTIRRYFWIVPVVVGLMFIAGSTYAIGEGLEAQTSVTAELQDEQGQLRKMR